MGKIVKLKYKIDQNHMENGVAYRKDLNIFATNWYPDTHTQIKCAYLLLNGQYQYVY